MAQSSCCPDGSWEAPLVASYDNKSLDSCNGECLVIGPGNDLGVYVAKPEDGVESVTKAIMVFTDVYGFHDRLFAICDQLANDLGVLVAALDCFRGDTRDNHLGDLREWIKGHPYEYDDEERRRPRNIHPVGKDIEWGLEFLSQKFGVSSEYVGAVGFCWGVWALTKACAMGINFKCAVGFHPSLKIEGVMFGMDQLAIAREAAKRTPLLFCVAGNDEGNLKPPDGEIARIIASSNHSAGESKSQRPQCVKFCNMTHGWVSRGDTSVSMVKKDAEKALKISIEFFAHWMGLQLPHDR